MRTAKRAALSEGSASASSIASVCIDCVPPSAPASAWTVTRIRFTSGCTSVSDTPAVCVWKRSHKERGFCAPKVSRISRAQMRRAARNFATSSKKSLWLLKKNDSRGAKSSMARPRSSAQRTYSSPSARVKASSWAAVEPASRMW